MASTQTPSAPLYLEGMRMNSLLQRQRRAGTSMTQRQRLAGWGNEEGEVLVFITTHKQTERRPLCRPTRLAGPRILPGRAFASPALFREYPARKHTWGSLLQTLAQSRVYFHTQTQRRMTAPPGSPDGARSLLLLFLSGLHGWDTFRFNPLPKFFLCALPGHTAL